VKALDHFIDARGRECRSNGTHNHARHRQAAIHRFFAGARKHGLAPPLRGCLFVTYYVTNRLGHL
jgi:hypothetical protein